MRHLNGPRKIMHIVTVILGDNKFTEIQYIALLCKYYGRAPNARTLGLSNALILPLIFKLPNNLSQFPFL